MLRVRVDGVSQFNDYGVVGCGGVFKVWMEEAIVAAVVKEGCNQPVDCPICCRRRCCADAVMEERVSLLRGGLDLFYSGFVANLGQKPPGVAAST